MRSETSQTLQAPSMREHGGPVEAELRPHGLAADALLDFSVNVNPYGPAPGVVAAVRGAALEVYPEPTAHNAREALAAHLGADAEGIVLGNGAAALLWTVAAAIGARGGRALVAGPTFSEFGAAFASAGGEVVEWRARESQGFAVHLSALERLLRRRGATAVYLCTPNNPTGVALPPEEVAALAARCPEVIFVVDESFLSLSVCHGDASLPMPDNVIRVRSLTKEQTLPGLRVGYLLAARSLARRVEQCRPPWSTSAPAQAAAIAACREGAFVAESRRRLLADRTYLEEALRAAGLSPLPSAAFFVLVRAPRASRLRARLLARHGILVRDCASFGLPGFVRLAARPAPDVRRLAVALAGEVGQ